MKTLKDDHGNELPKEVQERMDTFIDSLKNYKWFKPSADLKKVDVDKQAMFVLDCFGVKVEIEYRALKTKEDWVSAWASALDSVRAGAWDSALESALESALDSVRAGAWDSAMDSAKASAKASAWDSTWYSTWDSAKASAKASAWDSTWYSTWDSARASASASARASCEILLIGETNEFNEKYPNGAFRQLLKLWEMGLYPVGILKETGTFVIYADPIAKDLFNQTDELEVIIDGVQYVPKNMV